MTMDTETQERLAVDKEAARRDMLPRDFDFRCQGPGCANVLRKPRQITVGTTLKCNKRDGKDHEDRVIPDYIVSWSWCSQACFDAWLDQWVGRVPGTAWPVYDETHAMVAYVVPGRGRVSLDDIEAARDGGLA